MPEEFNIMVGGEAGQGVQSVGAILSGAMARAGFHIFADQDYESRVRGGHNFFRIRVSDSAVLALAPDLDVLVALNRESITLHEKEVKPDGIIIYDSEQTGLKSDRTGFLDVPLVKLAQEKAGNRLMANTVAIGAALGLIGYDLALLSAILKNEFGKHGEKTVQDNISAARAGYEHVRERHSVLRFLKTSPEAVKKPRMLINGNDAISLGAMVAGCKFVAGYPMTPASSILEYFADKGLHHGAVMLHVEDEISAINMAVGAGYTGVRSMVATSGGGFALMVEGLALAGMTETPVVVVLGQRPGPATGLPTRTEQGELFFSLHAGHGEFPRAVLAPASAADAFRVAVKAFNLAEKYQTPVIILTDHHLASSYTTVDGFDITTVKIERGHLLSEADIKNPADYKRYAVTASGVSPRALPGLSQALVVTDSDEHDEAGHMIEDAATRNQQVEKRARKLVGLKREVTSPEVRLTEGATITLIGWGSTYGAIREAAAILKKEGRPVNTLHFSQLWPFPSDEAVATLIKARTNIVVEGNATSQLAALIRRETSIAVNGSILKYDGRPFSPREIVERLSTEVKAW